jgi:hypothetical protein
MMWPVLLMWLVLWLWVHRGDIASILFMWPIGWATVTPFWRHFFGGTWSRSRCVYLRVQLMMCKEATLLSFLQVDDNFFLFCVFSRICVVNWQLTDIWDIFVYVTNRMILCMKTQGFGTNWLNVGNDFFISASWWTFVGALPISSFWKHYRCASQRNLVEEGYWLMFSFLLQSYSHCLKYCLTSLDSNINTSIAGRCLKSFLSTLCFLSGNFVNNNAASCQYIFLFHELGKHS